LRLWSSPEESASSSWTSISARSAERGRNWFLVGKPVGALGNPSACLSAKSYDLKAANRKSGEPIGEAPREKHPARQGDWPGNGERPAL
jgi:hypothetical protein